jgi:Holliday junction DNA helicase RuvA
MISSLQGILRQVGSASLVLEVGGVGFNLSVPVSVLEHVPAIGKPYFLYTRLIVREDSLTLYGFESPDQREVFELLLGVSGIGPRLGLAVLSHLSPEGLRSAVTSNYPEAFTGVPGVGRKTAEKIIFQLKDKMQGPAESLRIPSAADGEVLAALTGLGYSLVEAQAALQSLPEGNSEDVESRLRLALQYFAKS